MSKASEYAKAVRLALTPAPFTLEDGRSRSPAP